MPSPITGQIALSSSATQLSATATSVNSFTIKAPASNTATAYIGAAGVTTSTGYPLDPGETFEYERSSSNASPVHQLSPADVYAVGANPDRVGWFAD